MCLKFHWKLNLKILIINKIKSFDRRDVNVVGVLTSFHSSLVKCLSTTAQGILQSLPLC